MRPDETTLLRDSCVNETGKSDDAITADENTHELDISDAIEGAGYGFGTLLYQFGTVLFCCMDGAEIFIMSVVGPILKCEWNLSSFQLSMLQSSSMLAMTVGGLISAPLGDTIGRKPLALTGALMSTITGTLSVFSQNYFQFLISRTILGVFIGVGIIPSLVWCAETMPRKLRALGFAQNSLAWGTGSFIAAAIAYFVLEPFGWRGLVLSIPVVFFPSSIIMGFMKDSPRYDYYRGNHDKALSTIKSIYRLNCKSEVRFKLKPHSSSIDHTASSRLTFRSVKLELKSSGTIFSIIFIFIVAITSYFAYYVTSYAIPQILNEGYCRNLVVHHNQSCSFNKDALFKIGLVNLSEPLGLIITLIVIETSCGRRITSLGTTALSFLSAIPLYFCMPAPLMMCFFIIFRMMTASSCFFPIILVNEYMPTLIRNFMASVVIFLARSSSSLAIFVTEYLVNAGPRAVFGIIQFVTICSFCSLIFLKRETRDMDLL